VKSFSIVKFLNVHMAFSYTSNYDKFTSFSCLLIIFNGVVEGECGRMPLPQIFFGERHYPKCCQDKERI